MWAVWYATVVGLVNPQKTWKYKIFYSEEEAHEWYIDYRRALPWDELDNVEPPVPIIDGKPAEPEYIDRGCIGQLCMF